jgi:YlmC/YmxH family sporulation protein
LERCTTFCTLRCKDVVNIVDGACLGYVYDIEVNCVTGNLVAIVLPGRLKFFGLLGREDDICIRWECIRKIGEDTILVEYAAPMTRERPRKHSKW